MPLGTQIIWLFLLALPVASVSWTVTNEELFRELREWCKGRCDAGKTWIGKKTFYPFTCAFCFSHYVVLITLTATQYRLLFDDWRGYVIAGFSLVWIANVYMSLFELLRAVLANEKEE